MKRVLNSGSIKLPYIQGSENDILLKAKGSFYIESVSKGYYGAVSKEELIERICNGMDENSLKEAQFTFEIRAPLLVFIEGFQRSKLGQLTLLDGQDHQIGYLPQQYFKESPLGTTIMDAKACNDYNTKLNNFYNWSLNFYNKLIENGLCPAQAELALPQGIFRTFLFEINTKDLISFIEQNHDKSPEMAGYCGTLVLYMEDHLPNVTRWFKANKWQSLV